MRGAVGSTERAEARFNPETSISIQKRHPYDGNLNSQTLGDSENAFLHCGDVIGSSSMGRALGSTESSKASRRGTFSFCLRSS